MTNTELLKEKIDQSGYKRTFIAEQLGLSHQGLVNKLYGRSEFKQNEIGTLCILLGIDVQEKEKIFFDSNVDNTSTN